MDQHKMATALRQMAAMIDDDQMWMQELWVDIQYEIKEYHAFDATIKRFHTGLSMATINIELRAPLNVAQQFQEPALLETQKLLR